MLIHHYRHNDKSGVKQNFIIKVNDEHYLGKYPNNNIYLCLILLINDNRIIIICTHYYDIYLYPYFLNLFSSDKIF